MFHKCIKKYVYIIHRMSHTFKKTKKRMGHHLNKYVFRKGRKKDKSTDDSQGSCNFVYFYSIELVGTLVFKLLTLTVITCFRFKQARFFRRRSSSSSIRICRFKRKKTCSNQTIKIGNSTVFKYDGNVWTRIYTGCEFDVRNI